MTTKIVRHFLWSCFILLQLAFFSGCATSPNIPFAGRPYPSTLEELDQRNPLLVQELGKLPEIQDGISQLEKATLERIIYLYDSNPERFNEVFKEMYQIGKPNVRKYCTLLQALFWLVEDNKLEACNKILNTYNLNDYLRNAWDFHETLNLSIDQLKIIINTLPQKEQRFYDGITKQDAVNRITLTLFKHYPECFSRESNKLIKDVMRHSKYGLRWNNFNTVVERLNAPELIDYYSSKLFRWVDYRTIPTTPPRWTVTPQFVFKHKKGNCVAITDFIIYCLQRGGYRAYELQVPDRSYNYHSLCVFKKNGKKYLMDNGRSYPRGILPYSMKSTYFK